MIPRPRPAAAALLSARWVLPEPGIWLDGGGVLLRAGRVQRLARGRGELRRLALASGVAPLDLGDVVLSAAFVDAHAHLDLGALASRLSSRGSFASWIRELVRERTALEAPALTAGARAGALRLLSTGTTLAGDIDATGAAGRPLADLPLRVRTYREVLDAQDPGRTGAALARARRPFPRGARFRRGLSPHAPYTASAGLLAGVARIARRARMRVCIHWAETREEVRWLRDGSGPMGRILGRSPRRSGLDLVESAGLLGPRLLLVHGNHPEPGDVERVARSGAALAHCPGTHDYFGREPFDLRAWQDRGVVVALGTDSLASNVDLDMRREIALLRRACRWLSPERAWDMATRCGARALGFEGLAGELRPGAWADAVAHRLEGLSRREQADPDRVLDALTSATSPISAVWVGGRMVHGG